jgi:hypothetical protein
MAKLHTVKAARKERRCRGGHTIQIGEPYQWRKGRRTGKYIGCPQHPVPWYATSSSKMVPLWEAAEGFDADAATVVEDVKIIAEAARDVAQEYESGVQYMPENLQYGAQAEAMESAAEELNNWADELDEWASAAEDYPVEELALAESDPLEFAEQHFECIEPFFTEPEGEDPDERETALREAVESWIDDQDTPEGADDLMTQMPEGYSL